MTDLNAQEPMAPEEKELGVEEKLEILKAQLGFSFQAIAELDAKLEALGNFIQMVFSLSAARPEEEASSDDQPES